MVNVIIPYMVLFIVLLLSAVAAVQPLRNPSDAQYNLNPTNKDSLVSRSKSAGCLSGKQNERSSPDEVVVLRRQTRQTQNSQEAKQKQASETNDITTLYQWTL